MARYKEEQDSIKLIQSALDRGINFLDNSWDYHNGRSERWIGQALKGGYRQKAFLMTKIDGRTKGAAMMQIDESLKALQTDHIDLLQHHEVLRFEDPDRIFANGSLTIGTLDGANIEIRDRVGAENFFLFGLTTPEVAQLKAQGYRPQDYYQSNAELKAAIDQIASGYFSKGDRDLFKPLIHSLKNQDDYLLFADYQSYIDCQKHVSHAYQDTQTWTKMSILNAARIGYFSSDRAIQDYSRDIWHVQPVPIQLEEDSESRVPERKVTTH